MNIGQNRDFTDKRLQFRHYRDNAGTALFYPSNAAAPRHGAADGGAGRPGGAAFFAGAERRQKKEPPPEAEAPLSPLGPSRRPERSGGQNNRPRAAAPRRGADKMEDARHTAPSTVQRKGAGCTGRERRRPERGGP